LIMSGGIASSTARNLGLAIYSASISSDTAGGITDTQIFSNVGTDVSLFVSGVINDHILSVPGTSYNKTLGVSLFGGDTVVSGTLHADGVAGGAITGSITRTKDGLSYLVASSGVTITSASNGQILISSTGGSDTQNTLDQAYDEGGAGVGRQIEVTDGAVILKEGSVGSNVYVLGVTGSAYFGSPVDERLSRPPGSDAVFFVSGAIGALKSTGHSGKKAVFGGDLVTSGTLFGLGPDGGAITGSITHTKDGISYLVGASGITITSASNGQVTIAGGGSSEWTDNSGVLHPADSSGAQDVVIGGTTTGGSDIILKKEGGAIFNEQLQNTLDSDFRVGSDTKPSAILVDASTDQVAFLVGGAGISPKDASKAYGINALTDAIPSEINLFVSGAISGKHHPNASKQSHATFGGDLVASGTAYFDSVDAGTIHTYRAVDGAMTFTSASKALYDFSINDGTLEAIGGEFHYRLEDFGGDGGSRQGFAIVSDIPQNARLVRLEVTGRKSDASSGNVTLAVSGSIFQDGQSNQRGDNAQEIGTVSMPSATGRYVKIAGNVDLKTLFNGVSPFAYNGAPAAFGIFRKDTTSAIDHFEVYSVKLQYKM